MATPPIPQLSESVVKHARRKFDEREKTTATTSNGFDDFLRHLTNPASSTAPPIKLDPSLSLAEYFISTSHNSYLSGNQLWSKASTDAYKDILKRQCRCIEIDVWDGDSPSRSGSESEERGGEANKINRAMKKGIARLRSTSSTSTKDQSKTTELSHSTSKVEADESRTDDNSDVKKLTDAFKKGLTRLRSGSGTKGETNSVETEESPTRDPNLPPTPWRTQSAERSEPRVLHGHTATKEISFRSVCEIIRDYAFRTSELPLIVSLEVHCNPAQQELMVDIMNDYWKPYLIVPPTDLSDETPLPSLASLMRKILIKVKYVAPEKAKAKKAGKAGNESSDDGEETEPVKKGKIIEILSLMGTYTRSYHFSSLSQPEARIPTHVFSASEKKLISLQEQDADGLFKHNASYLMRAFPKGTRVLSSNLDPAPFWRQGVQMVALNWQKMNAAMMLNEAMFENSGGWVTKPNGYRMTSNGTLPDIARVSFDFRLQVLAAQNLDQDAVSTPNVFVKVELHVGNKDGESIPSDGGKNKGGDWKRSSAVRRSRDPDFGGETLEFLDVKEVVEELSFIRIKVCDNDTFQKSRLLGWTCFRLDRFPSGLQLLPLKDAEAKPNGGFLLVESRIDRRE